MYKADTRVIRLDEGQSGFMGVLSPTHLVRVPARLTVGTQATTTLDFEHPIEDVFEHGLEHFHVERSETTLTLRAREGGHKADLVVTVGGERLHFAVCSDTSNL